MLRKLKPLPSYINGEFLELAKPDKEFLAINPENPAELVAVTSWKKELVSPIIEGLSSAYELFKMKTFEERLGFVRSIISELRQHSDELKVLMMQELARSRNAVDEEWALCETLFALLPQFCEEALREKVSPGGWTWRYAPLGKVFVSSNVALPLYSLLSSAFPALIAGNSVCIRPSIHCPLSGYFLARVLHKLACPVGLVQVVFGDLDVYRQIISTHGFETVLYSGGEESLEQIRRDLLKEGQTRMVLCSGGKNAALVCKGADLQKASAQILHGMTVDCGQRLESTSLVFVEKSVLQEFTQLFIQAVKNVPTGVRKPLETAGEHVMGPLCSENAWERFLRFQAIASRECDETLRWGKPIDNPTNGFYVSPGVHLMSQQKLENSVYASNAFFGPDVAIIPVGTFHEAIGGIDRMSAARSLAIFASDQSIVEEVRRESDVPTVMWNCPTTTLDPHLPTFGRGRAGNSHVTGLRFLFSTVYPKTLSIRDGRQGKNILQAMVVLLGLFISVLSARVANANYQKAVEGNEVVKGKLYPKAGKVQVSPLQFGAILNQSFVSTFLIPVGLTYHINEWHAINAEFVYGISSDQGARECVESFFFEPRRARTRAGQDVGSCNPNPPNNPEIPADETKGEKGGYQRKPAYVPIRQVNQMYSLNYQWTPVYGKALWFMTAVGYLDFYTTAGLGLASTTLWPLKDSNASGKLVRDEGVPNENTSQWGIDGRPEPLDEIGPTLSLGIGTRFYFAKIFTANIDFRNTTLMGDDGFGGTSFMNYFTIWAGLGVIL